MDYTISVAKHEGTNSHKVGRMREVSKQEWKVDFTNHNLALSAFDDLCNKHRCNSVGQVDGDATTTQFRATRRHDAINSAVVVTMVRVVPPYNPRQFCEDTAARPVAE